MNIYRRVVAAWSRRRLDTHLSLVFGATVVIAMLGMMFYVNNQAVGLLERASNDLFERTVSESQAHVDKNITNIDMLVRLFTRDAQATRLETASQGAFLERLKTVLDSSPVISAIYIGYEDGGFVLLRQLTSPIARRNLAAPDAARYFLDIIRTDEGQAPVRRQVFLDERLRRVALPAGEALDYDPRSRPWYMAARDTAESVLTDPYWFAATQERGVTVARRLQYGGGVIGVDLSLADLSQELVRMKSTASSELLILNANDEVIASSYATASGDPAGRSAASLEPIVPAMMAAAMRLSAGGALHSQVEQVRGRDWVMRAVPLKSGPWTFRMVMATPQDEMLAGARDMVSALLGICAALVWAAILVIQVAARTISSPLAALAREAEDIQAFRFQEAHQEVRSSVKEVETLSQAIGKAGATIRRFIEIGAALAAERDPNRLMGRLLQETLSITGAEGGIMLLSEDGGGTLSVIAQDISSDGVHAEGIEPRPLPNEQIDAQLLQALARKTVSHFDQGREGMSPLLASLTDSEALAPGEIFRFSVIPLLNRADEVIGGIVIASRVPQGAPVSDEHLELARALSGNAAVAIETTLLLKARKALLDAVIRMIAQAIDAKSPYTSGHCRRVPVLTEALTRAACESRNGPFADFSLTPEEWEAVEVAGWLHDCGKLITAEYVVDKATKLETIYNRLHEIRMRFELLKSYAHIAYWRGLAEGGDEASLRAARDAELATLDEEFAFVARCNEGGEAMAEQDIARLRAIGSRKWLRTLDDRIGVSVDELARKSREPAPALPVEESLLADRPDHIIEHFPSELSELEDKAGFRMKRPEHRMNLGEIYNLSIGRGTLTAEERYEINRHITSSIVMLEGLPLVGKLKQVPEFAGGHHEKMDGTGYPRGLKRDEMSVVARIIAIADVFEALTAADRPYKKAKPLSEAVRIMGFMKRDRHLDPDLLDLFLASGIWREYARNFLAPDQQDEPDIDAVLAIRPAAA